MRHSLFKAWAGACVLTMTLVSHAQRVQSAYGYDLMANLLPVLPLPVRKPSFFFLSRPTAPYSNRYIPEMQRLENKFATQHVVFWFVYPNAGEALDAVRQHETAYGAKEHVLLDPHHQLVAPPTLK
jgi:hypothetical protein